MNNELESGKHYRDSTSNREICGEAVTGLSKGEIVLNVVHVMS
jgi:hypothetical protein